MAVARLVKMGGIIVDLLKNWKPGFRALPIGAGGYITGITSVGGKLYCRTDVGGAYRYDTDHWTQLVTATGITTNRSVFDYNTDAFAAAPSNPDVVYYASGNGNGGRVRSSSDGGTTWTRSSSTTFYIAGNEANRFGGQRIAVDPDAPLVAYWGPRKGGAWLTTDGAVTWTQLTGMPAPVGDSATTGALGVPCIVIDRDSTITSGRHQHVWASVYGVGLVHSTDGGTTWTTLVAWNPTGGWVSDMLQAPNGDLIAAFYDPGNTSRVKRITQTGTVTNIDPGQGAWQFVAVDPTNPTTMFITNRAMNVNFNTKRTTDGGTTWANVTSVSWSGTDAAWITGIMPTAAPWYLGQAVYHNGNLLIAESHGVWQATAVATNHITWQSVNKGVEELTANVVHKVPGKPLLTAEWDYGLFAVPDGGAAYLPFQTTLTSGWDIASSPTDPNFITVILDDVNDATDRGSGYSTDGGATWTRFPYLTTGTPATDLHYGNIAVSANNNNNIVWVPSVVTGLNSKVYYSTDRGTTFTSATLTGLTSSDTLHNSAYYQARHTLVADPTTAGTFYILGFGASSVPVVWKSTDSGATWAKQTTTGLSGNFGSGATLINDGTRFWAVPTSGTGLYYSTDCLTWSVQTSLSNAISLGIGAALPGSSNLTLYTYGTATAGTGFLQSSDLGATWTLLADYPFELYTGVRHIAGDLEVPGKVYVAPAGGVGFAVGIF